MNHGQLERGHGGRERVVVEGERRKRNRIKKKKVLSNSEIAYGVKYVLYILCLVINLQFKIDVRE